MYYNLRLVYTRRVYDIVKWFIRICVVSLTAIQCFDRNKKNTDHATTKSVRIQPSIIMSNLKMQTFYCLFYGIPLSEQ